MKKSFILLDADIPPLYHLNLIRQGIREFIENNNTPFQYSPLTWAELKLIHPPHKTKTGIVGWFRDHSSIKQFEEQGIPYLNLSESAISSNVGLQVAFAGEGTLAADFFIRDMKIENLVFVGVKNASSNLRRLNEYRQRATKDGIPVHNYSIEPQAVTPASPQERTISIFGHDFIKLIRTIPKPVGIFCGNDQVALSVQHTALEMGFSVPEEISVIGIGGITTIDNEGLNTISVIQLDYRNQGKIGASMIVNHLMGKPQQNNQQLIPDGITHRATTINRNVTDPMIQKTMTVIREDPALCVDLICQRLGISRRTLEKRFRLATNTTLARSIDLERFNKAKMLIKADRYNQESIAGLSGYANRAQMRRSFYRFACMSPRQYRQNSINDNTVSSR